MARTIVLQTFAWTYADCRGCCRRLAPSRLPRSSLAGAGEFGRTRLCFGSSLLSSRAAARSTSSGLRSSCRIRAASSSSLLISLDQSIAVQDAIVLSIGIMGFYPYISSTGMYPVIELWVVRSAHSAYGSKLSQSSTRPSHARTKAFPIGAWPRSNLPFASGLYACKLSRGPMLIVEAAVVD